MQKMDKVEDYLSFKVKNRWCRTCGAVKSCPACTGRARSGNGEPVVSPPFSD